MIKIAKRHILKGSQCRLLTVVSAYSLLCPLTHCRVRLLNVVSALSTSAQTSKFREFLSKIEKFREIIVARIQKGAQREILFTS